MMIFQTDREREYWHDIVARNTTIQGLHADLNAALDRAETAEARADALAAEVERLRAQSTGEWRNPPTSPVNDEWFEVRVRVRYLPDQNCYKTNFGDEIGIDAFEGWRPAPPQE